MKRLLRPVVLALVASTTITTASASAPWGATGHTLAARAAAERLPTEMPGFMRDAAEQLAWLNPEPDRWRSGELRAMDQGFSYDHYIDFENVPAGALEAADRWRFVEALYRADVIRPERDVGFLPYRIDELYQRLVTGFRMWREVQGEERRWVEARIVNDAGILGHYVTDGSQPHHTTIHFNGWNASGAQEAPNPESFTTERDFHARFETAFVRAHIHYDDVLEKIVPEARELGTPEEVRTAVRDFLQRTHDEVVTLYRLEKERRFDPASTPLPAHRDFTATRLAAGAEMLRDLWWSAWLDSARP